MRRVYRRRDTPLGPGPAGLTTDRCHRESSPDRAEHGLPRERRAGEQERVEGENILESEAVGRRRFVGHAVGFRAGDGMHAERARRIRIQPGGRHRTQAEGGEDVAQVRGRGNAFSPRIELRSSPGLWESSGQSRQRAGIWRAGRCHVTRDDLSFGPGSVIYSPENSVNDFIVSFSSSINWNPALRDFHKKHTWHIIEPRNMFLKFSF